MTDRCVMQQDSPSGPTPHTALAPSYATHAATLGPTREVDDGRKRKNCTVCVVAEGRSGAVVPLRSELRAWLIHMCDFNP